MLSKRVWECGLGAWIVATKRLASYLFVALLCSGLVASSSAFSLASSSNLQITPGKGIGPILLGMNEADLSRLMGPPSNVQTTESHRILHFRTLGISVWIAEPWATWAKAVRIRTTNPHHRTQEGYGPRADSKWIEDTLCKGVSAKYDAQNGLEIHCPLGGVIIELNNSQRIVALSVTPQQALPSASASRSQTTAPVRVTSSTPPGAVAPAGPAGPIRLRIVDVGYRLAGTGLEIFGVVRNASSEHIAHAVIEVQTKGRDSVEDARVGVDFIYGGAETSFKTEVYTRVVESFTLRVASYKVHRGEPLDTRTGGIPRSFYVQALERGAPDCQRSCRIDFRTQAVQASTAGVNLLVSRPICSSVPFYKVESIIVGFNIQFVYLIPPEHGARTTYEILGELEVRPEGTDQSVAVLAPYRGFASHTATAAPKNVTCRLTIEP